MARNVIGLLVLLLGMAIWAGSASASTWPKDPRVCTNWVDGANALGSPYQRSHCAMDAAKLAVRAKAGDAQITCTEGTTMLRWNCQWGTTAGGNLPISYRVVFSLSKHQWWVLVTT